MTKERTPKPCAGCGINPEGLEAGEAGDETACEGATGVGASSEFFGLGGLVFFDLENTEYERSARSAAGIAGGFCPEKKEGKEDEVGDAAVNFRASKPAPRVRWSSASMLQ